jgi:hypothetical protein
MTNHPKQAMPICGLLFVLVALWFLFVAKAQACVARLGGLGWRRNQFCRGWLITGDTGSGKTSSGVTQLAHQVFQNEPTWGDLCIDEKSATAQSTTSFVPPLGNDKSKVLTLNLRNRLIFRAADEADAVQAADFIGKKRVIKRSWGYSAGRRNVNYSETEEHRIKPHKLRNLRDHECVLVHCERGFRRVTLPPLEPDGTVSTWFSRGWL